MPDTSPPWMTEDRARTILGPLVTAEGHLLPVCPPGREIDGDVVIWYRGESTATLDADFTAEELLAIAYWMLREVPQQQEHSEG